MHGEVTYVCKYVHETKPGRITSSEYSNLHSFNYLSLKEIITKQRNLIQSFIF